MAAVQVGEVKWEVRKQGNLKLTVLPPLLATHGNGWHVLGLVKSPHGMSVNVPSAT